MDLTYRNLFEIMNAIHKRCNTKHWPLLKGLTRWIGIIQPITTPISEQCKLPESVKAFDKASTKLQGQLAGEDPEVVQEKMEALLAAHPNAKKDGEEVAELEEKLLADIPDPPVELQPIHESCFHKGDVCIIEMDAFLLFTKLGLVDISTGGNKVTKLSRKKRKK